MSKVLNALRALVVLLATLVGLPVVLVLSGPSLLAASSWSTFDQVVAGPDHASGVVLITRIVGWAVWVYFLSGFVAALFNAVTTRAGKPHTDARRPRLGWSQKQAAGLIAAVALILPGFGASAAMAATTSTPTAVTSVQIPAASPQGTQTQPTTVKPGHEKSTTTTKTPERIYHVLPGDTPWSIAERELGSGARADEIIALNKDRPQPGGTTLGQNKWPKQGWTLLLPAAAGSAQGTTPASDGAVETVKPGDTLWDYANEAYGDGSKYTRIFKANKGKAQPSGHPLTDPDLIRPGDKLIIPSAVTAPGLTSTKPSSVDVAQGGAGVAGLAATSRSTAKQSPVAPDSAVPMVAELAPAPPASVVAEPTPVTAAPVAPDPVVAEPAPQVADSAFDDTTTDDAPEQSSMVSPGLQAVGAITAFGLLALLGAKRVRQRRKLRRGQSLPPVPEAALEPERWLRDLADPGTTRATRHALRALCAHYGQQQLSLPSLLFARTTATSLTVWFTQPTELPTPWVAANPAASSWSIEFSAAPELGDYDELSALVPAPWPALVTIGRDQQDGELLIDLEYAGALTVTGDKEQATAVLRALAVALAVGNFADYLQVTVVGFCSELPAALGNGVLRYQPTIGHLLEELTARAHSDRLLMAEDGALDVAHARAAQLAADTHPPEIIILGVEPTPAQRADLEELVTDLPRVAIAAVSVGAAAITDWSLTLDGDTATLEPMGLTLTAASYCDAVWAGLLAGLNSADLPPMGIPTAHTEVPTRPEFELLPPMEPAEENIAAVDADLATEFVPAQASQHIYDDMPACTPTTTTIAADDLGEEPVSSPDPIPTVEVCRGINIMGPVTLPGWPPIPPELSTSKEQMSSLAAYIAANPGADQRALLITFWQEWLDQQAKPGVKAALKKPSSDAVSKLRKWIGGQGTAEAGAKWLPKARTYTFAPDVVCDWQVFQELTAHGAPETVTDTAQLTRALALVRGVPFAHAGYRYAWTDEPAGITSQIKFAVVETALEVAARQMRSGRFKEAAAAARAGLRADDAEARLIVVLLEATRMFNRPEAVSIAERCRDLSEKLDGLDDDADSLIGEILASV